MTDVLTDVCYPGETGLPCTVAVGLYHRAFETLHRCRDLDAEIGSDVWENGGAGVPDAPQLEAMPGGTVTRPLLVDLFCGAGGAAVGYHRAGFDVVGVDIAPQPDYPFEFVLDDASRCDEGSNFSLRDYDAIHASPPCQSYSAMSNRWGSDHPELIGQVRSLLMRSGRPFVIENVEGARRDLREPIVRLTGGMFGLAVYRPRLFELGGWFTLSSPPVASRSDDVRVYGPPDGRRVWTRTDGSELRAWSSIEEGQKALGIDWTDDWHQLREAIPPAYTEWIGSQLLAQIGVSP